MQVGIYGAGSGCIWTFPEFQGVSTSGDGYTWVVALQPDNGGIRSDELMCIENGEEGLWHDVFRDGVDVGNVCVPNSQQQQQSIDELALRAFKRYSWPTSDLVVQPDGNETLVNLETIFFTSNDSPSTHAVTLAGQRVEIEAVPTYTWFFGDGTSETTTTPGHAYPDHDVFHVYAEVAPVTARVDTTYRGRFRVGDGPWRDIDETLTVAGDPVDLTVLEARPTLVR